MASRRSRTGRAREEIAGLLKPGMVVGLLAETGSDFMAAHLGAIYAGATVMPRRGPAANRIKELLDRAVSTYCFTTTERPA